MVRPSRDPSRPKPASITAFHHGDWHYTNAPYVAPADVGAVCANAGGNALTTNANPQARKKFQFLIFMCLSTVDSLTFAWHAGSSRTQPA